MQLARIRWARALLLLAGAACSLGAPLRAARAGVAFPLHVSSDHRHLLDALGRPFFLNGDAAWSLMVALDLDQTEAYLEDRRQKGINTILVNLIERGFGGPENQDGELPFVPADDYTSPNEAYFEHADQVIDMAASKGMLVLLTPSYLGSACGSQGWCEQMLAQSVDAMLAYGRFLGARYASRKNILWVHGGDANSEGFGADGHVNAIAQGIREMAPGAQLHTAHCSRNRSAIDCYDEPWLDVNDTYSHCSGTLGAAQEDYDRVPAQPFFYIEGQYENENADLQCLVSQHAWAVLSGAFGHVFGNSPIWRFGSGWEAEIDSPGSVAMSHLGRLFLSRAWFRLEPDLSGEMLVAGGGADAAAARTSDGETAIVFVPDARSISVDVSRVSGSAVRAWWFDPTDGSAIDLDVVEPVGTLPFDSPGTGFLVLDDAAGNLPPPGQETYADPSPVPAAGGPLWPLAPILVAATGTRALARRGRDSTS